MYSIGFGQPPGGGGGGRPGGGRPGGRPGGGRPGPRPRPRPRPRPWRHRPRPWRRRRHPRQIPATGPLFWYDAPYPEYGPSIITAETTRPAKQIPGLGFLRAASGFLHGAESCKTATCVAVAAIKASKHLKDYVAATKGRIEHDLVNGALGYLAMISKGTPVATAMDKLKKAVDMVDGQIGLHEQRVAASSGPVQVEFTPW